MSAQKTDVSVNIAQDFNDTQKARGRSNIGATRVVYVDTTSSADAILSILNAGDLPVLKVVSGSTAYLLGLVYKDHLSVTFTGVVYDKVTTYSCRGTTWTITEQPYTNQFTTKNLDRLRRYVNADDEITTIGNIKLSYFFDSNARLRLVWVPASETQTSLTIYSDHGYFSWANVTTSQPQAVGADQFINSYGQRETIRWYTDSTFVVLEFFFDEADYILHWRRVS